MNLCIAQHNDLSHIMNWRCYTFTNFFVNNFCAGTAAVNAIRAAMDQFMLDTCIRFIPKNPFHFDYLYFFSGTG